MIVIFSYIVWWTTDEKFEVLYEKCTFDCMCSNVYTSNEHYLIKGFKNIYQLCGSICNLMHNF